MVGWIVFGLIVGILAKFLMPGKDPEGCIITILLGIGGSFTGGYIGRMMGGSGGETSGWIGSIAGAMLLLFLYRILAGKRGSD